jgi:hypothetical protein
MYSYFGRNSVINGKNEKEDNAKGEKKEEK